MFGQLDAAAIEALVRQDDEEDRPAEGRTTGGPLPHRAIHRVWEDFEVKALIDQTVSTVKANAGHNAFAAVGSNIV